MKLKSRRGDSSIITTLLLTSVVIAIGIVLMSFFSGTNTIRQNDYFDQTLESVHNIQERFCVENIGVTPSNSSVRIWIYNYGNRNITVDRVRITMDLHKDTMRTYSDLGWAMAGGVMSSRSFSFPGLGVNSIISVEITSSRENKVYDVTKRQS